MAAQLSALGDVIEFGDSIMSGGGNSSLHDWRYVSGHSGRGRDRLERCIAAIGGGTAAAELPVRHWQARRTRHGNCSAQDV